MALHGSGSLAMLAGDLDISEGRSLDALAIFEELGAIEEVARVMLTLGLVAHRVEDVDEARSWLEKGLRIGRELGSDGHVVTEALLRAAASLAICSRSLEQADQLLQERAAIGRALKDDRVVAQTLANLSVVAEYREDWLSAEALARDALTRLGSRYYSDENL